MTICTFVDREEALKFARSIGKEEVLRVGADNTNLYVVALRPMHIGMINPKGGKTVPFQTASRQSTRQDRIYFVRFAAACP